ncbi:MAG: hypothetical protein WAT19_00430 [Ferruginibacter sp.]
MFSKTGIEKYFLAEKNATLFFLVLGIVSIAAAVILYFVMKTSWHKGFAIPLLVIGLLQGIVGYTVYKRCDADRKKNVYAFDMSPQLLKNQELPRMEKVSKNFSLYMWAEILLLLAGIGLYVYARNNDARIFWSGFGLALALQALISLGFDYFAQQRAKLYTKGLVDFSKTI